MDTIETAKKTTDKALLNTLADDHSVSVREAVADNPNTPRNTLVRMVTKKFEYATIRLNALYQLDDVTISELIGYEVKLDVIIASMASRTVIDELLKVEPEAAVKQQLAKNPNISDEQLAKLIRYGMNHKGVYTALTNTNCGLKTVTAALTSKDRMTADTVVSLIKRKTE